MTFVRPYRWAIALTLVIGIVKFVIPLLLPLLIAYVIDDIVLSEILTADEKLSKVAWVMGSAVVIYLVVRPPVEYYRQYFAQWTASKILYDIRERAYGHLQQLSFRFYANNKVGEVISRVIHDVEQTKNFVVTGLMNVWLDIATIIIAIGIMFTLDVPLTFVAIILFPLYGGSVKYFFGRLRSLTRVRSQALADVQSHLHERVSGMAVVKSFAIEEHDQRQFDERNDTFLHKALDHTRWNAKAFAVVNTITDIAPLLVLAVAAYQAIQGSISVGEVAAFLAYIERLYSPLRRLVNSSTTLTQSIASMDRMFQLFDEPYDIENSPNAKALPRTKGEIIFDHVSFRYNDEDDDTLKDVHLHVKSGETIALVGMSGGGKSTIVSLLPRFYDVTDGKILLDGVDIKEYDLTDLRNQYGIVLQDTILFSDTIKENIKIGKPGASDEEVVAAAKAANAHTFIEGLTNSYDTQVGERGVKLSGGQKQRIAIARVFLKNPPILLLDEATSALDVESEKLIQDALEELAKDRTTFIVAHRLSTIAHADRIVVLEHGKVVEMGTHDELIRKDGAFHRLLQQSQV
ncbi:ABC transporter ATP-binding protein [Mangrovibacillus cuniculi]|uniref:ABC transporter ATP-binding protein n=2 Tax=Mangrovibacillus cuniculi TaxID=2593652 RepID=A0A7S8CE42_9BACI|nr:ABC transporter ATP-binding protein [Mangrovibacillus cuniculi]